MHRDSRAFSLVETLVVVGIVALLSAISFVAFIELSRKEALSGNAAAIATRLRDARARTLASVGGMQHGVLISTTSVTFFRGAVYDPASTTNDIFPLSTYVRASSTLSSIVFERITGNASASGTIELFLASDPLKRKNISVQSSGLVNIE